MKKIYALYFLLFLSAFNYAFSQPYKTFGSASVINAATNVFRLTPDAQVKAGTVWSQTTVDFTKCFKLHAQLNFGTVDNGADGIALILSTKNNLVGVSGGGIGYADIPAPAFTVEFDDFQNGGTVNDPVEDHLAFTRNGSPLHPTNDYHLLPDLESGLTYDAVFTWNPATKLFTVNFLNTDYSLTEDIVSTIFGGTSNLYFGFTGATGNQNNLQTVKILSVQNYCPLSFSLIKTDIKCYGSNDGSATLTISGGKPSYTYILDGVESAATNNTTIVISNLSAGDHTVSVKDMDGNISLPQMFTILQPVSALASTADVTDVACFGAANGSVIISATGGTAPYTGTGTLTNIAPGTYNYTVTDANGCTTSGTYTIAQPAAALTSNAVATDISCFGGSNGSVVITAAGGTAPYTGTGTFTDIAAGTYNYTVTDANGCTTSGSYTIAQPAAALTSSAVVTNVGCFGSSNGSVVISATGGTAPYTGTGTFTNIAAGTYNYTVTDANGCTTNGSYTVAQPTAALVASASVADVSCFGASNGSVVISAEGGTAPYTGTGTFTNKTPGTYNYTVTDSKGCTTSGSYTIAQPSAAITANAVVTNVSCFGAANGSVVISATGGTAPYTGIGTFTNKGPGTYSYTVTDAKGCTKTGTYTIAQPTAINTTATVTNVSCYGSSTGSVVISATGGTAPYTGTGTFSNRAAGTYSYTVTDAKGCTKTGSYTIGQPATPFAVTKETFPNSYNTGFSKSLVNKTFTGASGTWTANSNANAAIAVLKPYYSPSTSYALKIVNFKTKGCYGGGAGTASATSPKISLAGACCPTDVNMSFTLWSYTCVKNDSKASLSIDFSKDNGATWSTVWTKTSAQIYSAYGTNGKATVSVNVPVAYQNANFKYRFRGDMQANDDNNFYVFVDDISFGSCEPAAPTGASIGDYVWNDKNGNGIQEETEPGIAGAVVTLTKIGGRTESTKTDSDGAYKFTNLDAGIYLMSFVTPSGFEPSPAKRGNDDDEDSDPILGLVLLGLKANEDITSIDAGFTAHSSCSNECDHFGCNHSNCDKHNSCRNNCNHDCNHSNCGKHTSCRNNCSHTSCSHSNCKKKKKRGENTTAETEANQPIVSATNAVAPSIPAKAKDVKLMAISNAKLEVKVLSNPTINEFTLQITGKTNQPVSVRLVDLNGRVMSTHNIQANNTLKVGGSLHKGGYIAEVVQGDERKVVKLIKL